MRAKLRSRGKEWSGGGLIIGPTGLVNSIAVVLFRITRSDCNYEHHTWGPCTTYTMHCAWRWGSDPAWSHDTLQRQSRHWTTSETSVNYKQIWKIRHAWPIPQFHCLYAAQDGYLVCCTRINARYTCICTSRSETCNVSLLIMMKEVPSSRLIKGGQPRKCPEDRLPRSITHAG